MTSSLRRFLSLLFQVAPRAVAWSVALMVVAAATEGVGILMLVPLLGLAGVTTGGPALAGPASMLTGLLPQSLGPLLVLYVVVVSARAAVERAESLAAVRVDSEVTRSLRERLYRALVRARWETIVPMRGARLGHVLTAELERLSLATNQLLRGLLDLCIALTYALAAFLVSPTIALVASAGALLLLAVAWGQQRAARNDGELLSSLGGELFAGATEEVATLKVAKSAGIGERMAQRYADRASRYASTVVAAHGRYYRVGAVVTAASAAALAVVVYAAVVRLHLAPASLLVLLFVCARLIPRLTSVQGAMLLTSRTVPAAEVVLALLEELEEASEPVAEGARREITLARAVELRGVSYTYPGAAQPSVLDVHLRIPAGEVTALIGPSGAGKSTIADLVLLLLTPSGGEIVVDGIALRDADRDAWRAMVGYVPQDTHLFHDTIRENVRWVLPDATDRAVLDALDLAGAGALLARLPAGLDTIIGDRGALLSGGERQRLALARALLRQPSLLVLDEATSALDPESERAIRDTIASLAPAVTVLVITHRLTSAREADRILVLDAGGVVDAGTWAELMERDDSRFAALWAAQHGGDDAGVAEVLARSS